MPPSPLLLRPMTNNAKIVTDCNVYWTAVLSDFDGAPDAKGPRSLVGIGNTERAAVEDLMEQLGSLDD
jgi:hypothetical protein